MPVNAIPAMKAAALRAGVMLRGEQSRSQMIAQSYKDFVTQQDLESERLIIETLRAEFPNMPFFAEESGGNFSQTGLIWIVDPLDGTISYYKGNPTWGISIALVQDGVSVAGVVYIPVARQLFSATIDSPTELIVDGESEIRHPKVSEKSELERCNVAIGYGKPGFANPPENPFWKIWERLRLAGIHGQVMTSCTAFMMKIVTGEVDISVDQPDFFDTAAAGLIVKQAGGRVTDFNGNDWKCHSPRTLTTNSLVHEQLLSIING